MSFPQQQNLKNSFVDFNTIKPVNVLKPEATEKNSRIFPELLLKITLKETSVRKNGNSVLSSKVVPETGVEPATNGLGNRCSIH